LILTNIFYKPSIGYRANEMALTSSPNIFKLNVKTVDRLSVKFLHCPSIAYQKPSIGYRIPSIAYVKPSIGYRLPVYRLSNSSLS
jgi:hypothetical protein